MFIKDIVIKNNMVNIIVWDEETETVFKLLPDIFMEHDFHKEQEITNDQYNELKGLHAYSYAYNRCLRKIALRDQSEKEIRDLLDEQQNLTVKQKEDIVTELKRVGYIDDKELVESYIALSQDNLYGINKIRFNLQNKGIDEAIISEALASVSEEDEIARAKEKATLLMRQTTKKSHREYVNSLKNKLHTAGYSTAVVNAAINSLDIEVDEQQEKSNLEREYETAERRYMRKYEGYELEQKIIACLERKGFRYGDIKEYMNERRAKDEDQ